jgi:hypothetical protein
MVAQRPRNRRRADIPRRETAQKRLRFGSAHRLQHTDRGIKKCVRPFVSEELEIGRWRDAKGEPRSKARRDWGLTRTSPLDRPRKKSAAISNTVAASCAVNANIETQSSDRHARTIRRILSTPRLGFSPTMLLNSAGMRPDPAVSVQMAQCRAHAVTAARGSISP